MERLNQAPWPGGGYSMLGTLTLLAGLGAIGLLRPALEPAKAWQPAFVMTEAVAEQVNTSPFALILGEIRASAADLMWVKTERYLHRGVAYAPHLNADNLARTGETVNRAEESRSAGAEHVHDEHCDHEADADGAGADAGHGAEVALIPDRESDYRGFIGVLHREVQPWEGGDQPHEHSGGEQLLPWYRLLTLSDPHHWRGFMIGAWWLMQQREEGAETLAEARSFIEEGIRHNPDVFQLHLMHGRVLTRLEEWDGAIGAFRRAVEVGLKLRPEGGVEEPPVWTLSEEEDFEMAVRYIAMIQARKMNDIPAALATIEWGLRLVPGDGPLTHLREDLTTAGE